MTLLADLVIGLIQLIIAIIFSVIALYAGLLTFNHLTGGFDAPGEIKRGNVAVGLLIASIYIGISIPAYAGIQAILAGLASIAAEGVFSVESALNIVCIVVELGLSILLAVAAIYVVMYIIAQVSSSIDVLREIKYGNTSMALVVASMILSVCIVVHWSIDGLFKAVFF
ncbi:DUF350 domain-containing protein [Methanoregula sp.]|jgi:uncharacterized membrane protein YjfL (UPF0719 family)|uniref:DUF350 domain-containing protein n=1 Tax=Methanoregula sp. TaxID=2052170 RepID=UPI003C1D8CBE